MVRGACNDRGWDGVGLGGAPPQTDGDVGLDRSEVAAPDQISQRTLMKLGHTLLDACSAHVRMRRIRGRARVRRIEVSGGLQEAGTAVGRVRTF